MTAGIQPTQNSINNQAGQIVLNARNAIQQIIFFNDYLQDLTAGTLVSLGFSDTDAASLLSVFANMAAIASACQGAAYTGPELPFNFLAQTVPLWGGQ
jgi:hypothetical protein